MSLVDVGLDLVHCAQNSWNGNEAAYADAAAVTADGMGVAGLDLASGDQARTAVNRLTGNNPNRSSERPNMGHHIGTVVGGLAGTALGPSGIAPGMAIGSDVGGWIADQF